MNFELIGRKKDPATLPPIEFVKEEISDGEDIIEFNDDFANYFEPTDTKSNFGIRAELEKLSQSPDEWMSKYIFLTVVHTNCVKVDPRRIPEIRNNLLILAYVLKISNAENFISIGIIAKNSSPRTDHVLIRNTRLHYLERFKNAFQKFLREIDKHFNAQFELNYAKCLDEKGREYLQFDNKQGSSNRCREYRKNLLLNEFNVVDLFGFDATYCVRSGAWSESEILEVVLELSALLGFSKAISESMCVDPNAKSAIFGAIYALSAYGLQDPYVLKSLKA
jgi:hypothetical protein